MARQIGTWLGLALVLAAQAFAADSTLIAPANRFTPEAVEWRALAATMTERGDVLAEFEERRIFPFRREPLVLRGEVRVSAAHGLSLHYLEPEVRTMVVDDQGVLVREPGRAASSPPDSRAAAANAALRHILRFDFQALDAEFELYGRQTGDTWSLALVPRAADVRRVLGEIFVDGQDGSIRQIELYRSAKQRVEIRIGPPEPVAFTREGLARYFR